MPVANLGRTVMTHAASTTTTRIDHVDHVDHVDHDDKIGIKNLLLVILGMIATYFVVTGAVRLLLALGWHA
jgi:hypothetical protein